MSRTSTLTDRRAPTGSISPSCSARRSLTCASRDSSPISSRNSVPPLASANLPTCFSVAPVKEPFSWPNRIDSTSVSGSAPQLTVTNGLPRRSELPWIARAISSLPTPDSPSIRTGMFDFAARSASRTVRAIDSARLTMSRKPSSPALRRVARRNSSSSASTRSAFLIDTCSRSAPTGLTTKSIAPARIAEMTASIEPCAVCTIAGNGDVALAHAREHAHAVEIGHHQIEDDEVDRRPVGRLQARERRLARIRASRRRSRTASSSPPAGGAGSGSSSTTRMRAAIVHSWGGGDAASPRVAPQSDITVNAMLMASPTVRRRILKSAAIVGAKEWAHGERQD